MDSSLRHRGRIACISPGLLQVIWGKKLSKVSNLQTGLKPSTPREQIYHILEAYFSWYKSDSM